MIFRQFLSCLAAGALIFIQPAGAQSEVLPEPLTLQAALQMADRAGHFQNMLADQALQQSIAEAEQTQSANDFSINLNGRLREIQRSGSSDPQNDSAIKLFVRKPLYDFGKTASNDDLATLKIELKQLEKQYLVEQRKVSIRQKYYAVLNADNQYLRDNEELAIGFIRYDRTRENQLLGLSSELEVLKTKAAYERIRQNRYNSENVQRLTRILLAEELGFADSPPNELALPELDSTARLGDDVDVMIAQAMQHSLRLRIENKKLQLAKQEIERARHTTGATLDAELELADYVIDSASRDDWRASIYLDVPLYSGSAERSAIKLATAKYQQQLAALQRVQSEIRIEVLTLWQAIRQNSLRVQGDEIDQEYRDMILDRSRAEYELEFKTDLGNSMVQYSESRRKTWQARLELDMAWSKLEMLLGEDFLEQIKQHEDNNG
jgi:outer membrane protein TolC